MCVFSTPNIHDGLGVFLRRSLWVGGGSVGAGRNVDGTWLERAKCVQAGHGQVVGRAEYVSWGILFDFPCSIVVSI